MVAFRTIVRCMLALVLAAPIFAATTDHATAQLMDKILREKKIKIGYIPSPPGTIKDPKSGEVTGYYVEGVRYIFKTINVEPEFVETTWATFSAGLNSGQFDLSIAGTFATIQRAAAVEFTMPIHYLGYSAVAKKGDTRFKKLADLNQDGIKIAVVQGGAGQEYVKENFPKATIVALATGNLTAPFVEVAAGRADIGIEDAWQARRFSEQQPSVTDLFRDEPYNVLPICWSVRRGNGDLLNFMNVAIDFMLGTGRWERIAEKYGSTGRFMAVPTLKLFGPSATAEEKKQ